MKKILYIAIAIFYLHMPEPVNANRFETSANNIVFAVPESQKFSVAQVGDALSSDGAQRAVTEGDPAGRNFVATMVIGSFQKDVAYTVSICGRAGKCCGNGLPGIHAAGE